MQPPDGTENGAGDPSAVSDASLIARWQRGDQGAAAALVARHAPALARFAASCGVRDQLEEVVQDTFVRAFGSLEGFRADSTLQTWLFTILRRLVLDRQRAEKRRRDDTDLDERQAVQEYNALDTLVAEETALRVRAGVARLSPMQREVFTLRVTEGMAYSDIAQVLGSTEGACRVHYHNAVRSVRGFLDDA